MKKQSTINKINTLLKTADYTGIPRGTILTSVDINDQAEDIKFLIRHKIICKAGDRYIINY